MVEFTKQVGNKIGLHLRAAGEFVKVAAQFNSEIRVYNGDRYANGKSILGLASLAAARGAEDPGGDRRSGRSRRTESPRGPLRRQVLRRLIRRPGDDGSIGGAPRAPEVENRSSMPRNKLDKVNGTANGRSRTKTEVRRQGISASPGIVVGTAFVRDAERHLIPRRVIDPSEIEGEVARFARALATTARELRALKSDIAKRMGDEHARIFDAHLLILDDRVLVEETVAHIRDERLNAAAAFEKVIGRFIAAIGGIEDRYLKERTIDIHDVRRRVVGNILGKNNRSTDRPTEPSIIVGHELSPSDTAQLTGVPSSPTPPTWVDARRTPPSSRARRGCPPSSGWRRW